MPDIVSPEVRSRMMSGIRGRDTKPELVLRRGLHALGFRYRISPKDVPGKPDMVFPRYHAVILAHGCFWHGHDCHLFRWPSSRREFWRAKISSQPRARPRGHAAAHGCRLARADGVGMRAQGADTTAGRRGDLEVRRRGSTSGERAGEIRGSDE